MWSSRYLLREQSAAQIDLLKCRKESTAYKTRSEFEDKTRKPWKERAEPTSYSNILDEMTTFDTFPATVQGFDGR